MDIALIQKTAIQAAGGHLLTKGAADLVILSPGETLESLERFQLERGRLRGSLNTRSLADFATYIQANGDALNGAGFVDIDRMTATVFLNIGNADNPGHCDWRATLTMKANAAYAAMLNVSGKELKQAELIDWLEDWSDFVKPIYGDETSSLSRAITSIRKLKITMKGESTNNVGDFGSSRSAMEEVEASSSDVLPNHFAFTAIPYEALSERVFSLKLSVLTGGAEPRLVLRLQQREQWVETIGQEFKTVLTDAIQDVVPLTIGTFDPGK